MSRLQALLFAVAAPWMLAGCFPSPDYRGLPDSSVIGRHVEVLGSQEIANLEAPQPVEREGLASLLAEAGETGVRVRAQLSRDALRLPPSQVVHLLTQLGVAPSQLVLERQSGGQSTRLTVQRTTLTAPDCSQLITPNESESMMARTYAAPRPTMAFGCATYSNLSRIIADPADLDQPAPLDEADGTATTGAVQRYHDNKVTPLRATSTTSRTSSQ